GADVVIGGEVALGGLLDGVEHGFVDSLDHGGQHDVAVFGALGPVVVDTNDPYITGIGGGSRGTEADGSGNRHDDVGVLGDELLRQCLALALVFEVPGEGAVLTVLVPTQQLDVGVVLLVVLVHAVGETVHEDGHRGDLLAA